jgi:hypothetical protein
MGEGFRIDTQFAGFFGEQRLDESSLVFLQLDDAFLDGAAADEFVNEDRLVLADAVGAVGGLVFGGGVPPRVVMNDRISGC